MLRTFILFLFLSTSLTSWSQADFDENKMVGFACFYEGRETKVVTKFKKMLKRKDYASMSKALQSKNSAEQFMAVICLQALDTASIRRITTEEEMLITKIKTSAETIDLCSGCFPNPAVKLHDAFTAPDLWRATPWLQQHLKN